MKRGWKLLWLGLASLATPAFSQSPTTTAVMNATAPAPSDESAPGNLNYVTQELHPGTDTKGPFYYMSENEMRMRKLCRGVANVGLCVAEIPNQMFQEAHKTSPVTGIVVGGIKGVGKGCERLIIGTWEILTFYHKGNNHYQPYVQPEVVMMEYLH